jgi:hypothetical protein
MKSIVKTDHFASAITRFQSNRSDDAIDAGRWSATYQHADTGVGSCRRFGLFFHDFNLPCCNLYRVKMLYEVYRFGTQIQDLRKQVFLDVKKLGQATRKFLPNLLSIQAL